MKSILFLIAIILGGCNNTDRRNDKPANPDTLKVNAELPDGVKPEKPTISVPDTKSYSNARFKKVTVEKIGDHKFLVQGMGQIFEASFSWVVEDGHEELKKGFEMTDAGAPEWGKFKFAVNVPKKRTNSTLTLILFESSPKDGSRQYELPVVLY